MSRLNEAVDFVRDGALRSGLKLQTIEETDE
jgi:hypothetical protein